MNAPTAERTRTGTDPAEHGHVVSLLLTDADDGLYKVLTMLRSRRWKVRSLQGVCSRNGGSGVVG